MRGEFFMMVPLPENEFTAIVGNLGYVLIILWRFHMSSDFCLIQRSEFSLQAAVRRRQAKA
jgi:hypothetical protein